ncbi:hypothetical protein P3T76_000333 [Phytophthora citrophthora]|uniref:Uncharacterized protein n=1 Tax=Phytophthora citrophthora TaxID=4793 RepID=A0AAD9H1F9_9STRA|nr:hypothetical protein P3T76_000333 [Phytophthora citrophthora]
MLFLPLEEDSLLFRLCLYYGALVLLLELVVPLFFHRRVRIEIPRLALRAPIVPLSTREFQHQRLVLQQQEMEMQRALEETARWSPQKRKQKKLSAAKQRVASPTTSPTSSPLASPTSSMKMARPKSSAVRLRMEEIEEKYQGANIRREEASQPLRQRPMAMSDSLSTRTSQRGGFSFDEISEEEKEEEKLRESEEVKQAVNMRPMRRRESPTFSGRRPVRLVEETERVGYSGPSEAAARLEALIVARRRQKAATSMAHAPVPVIVSAAVLPPIPASIAPAVESEKPLADLPLHAPKRSPPPPEVQPQLSKQQDHQAVEEDDETKETEQNKVLTDFQAFCATFAAGRSAAALQAATKRKHHEAFEPNVKTSGDAGVAEEDGDKRKHPRVDEHTIEDPIPAAATPRSVGKRTHYTAFGSDDNEEVDDTVAAQQVLEKRNHDQAFGTAKEQKQEKTPRIVRRISFSDEVDASPSKEVLGESSAGKRTHKQMFGMHDDEEEDADWRDSLAFRPHHFG